MSSSAKLSSHYTVLAILPIEEVFSKIDYHVDNRTKGKAEFEGHTFNVKSIVFRNKGLQCVSVHISI